MAKYAKGANAERELIRMLFGKGFAVARVAGSGVSPFPCPDIVALKQGKVLGIECKAWDSAYLSIPIAQVSDLQKWADTAGAEVYIGWKQPRKGWFFLLPSHFKKTNKFFIISQKKAVLDGLSINVLVGEQTLLSPKK